MKCERKRLRDPVLGLAIGLFAAAGCKAGGDSNAGVAKQGLSTPGILAPSRSTIDGHTWATPDEGSIEFPLSLDFCNPGELCVGEPPMHKENGGNAKVRFVYSKSHNTVDVYADFHNLPYRPTYTKEFDNSNEFDKQFMTVTDGKWQLWLIGDLYARHHETAYYSAFTLQFLGTTYDLQPYGPRPFPAAGTFIPVRIPVLQMICSPLFEDDPSTVWTAPDGKRYGDAHVHFTLQYNRIADAMDTPGVINSTFPFNLCEPDEFSNYYTNTMLPDSMFMTWDHFLQSIWNGEPIMVATSVEPDPKPIEIDLRDNTFIGWGNFYPNYYPPGFGPDVMGGTRIIKNRPTHQNAMWPKSRRHLCGG
jgi:hypothetical protein